MKIRFLKTSLLLILASVITACSDGSNQANSGLVTLNITDAPVDEADAVVVEFSSVTLKSDDNILVFDFDTPKSIDLLSLQGVASQSLIEDEEIPAGDYNQIQLGVNAEFDSKLDSYITINNTKHELRVPSGNKSGLKLNTPFTVAAGSSGLAVADEGAVYTIDFDLRKSIVDAKGQPGYFLKPVLRLVQNINTGSVSGTIDSNLLIGSNCSDSDPLTGNAIYVFSGLSIIPDDFDETGVEPMTTSLVSFDINSGVYSYEVGFLGEGGYTLAFTCAADLDDENDNSNVIFDVIDDITIIAGSNIDHPVD